MRIVGYIDHPVLKITIFKMDNKFSVKFESGLYEQTYKFRESDQIEDLASIKKIIDSEFSHAVLKEMDRQHQIKSEALSRFRPPDAEDEFEEII